MPLLSLCSTNYNTEPVTRRSLESVLRQVRGFDYEIVIVDSESDDGSYEALLSLRDSAPLVLERRRCSRGVGRNLAFERSRGEYVVTFDLDTLYNEDWGRLLRWVLRNHITFGLSAVLSQFYPRGALEAVGGWRDFQYWEDVDLWARLAAKGLYRTYPMVCGENLKRTPGRNRIAKAGRLYARCRDKVATTDWIPFGLYWRGYRAFLQRSGKARHAYHFAVFLAAYLPGLRKRARMYPTLGLRPSILVDRSFSLDLGLVPPESLAPSLTSYDTYEGCESALDRGDLGFLPGTYD